MKRILLAILALSISALAQTGVRFGDSQPIRSTVTIPGVQGTIPVLVSGAVITFCTAPANAVPCTNKATTYTDSSLNTACSTSTQVVLAGTSSCVGATDSSGAWGVWAAAGQYEWTVTANGASSGPYPATLGGSSSGGGSSGAVIIAPATTQVLQGTAPGVQTVFKMPTGAAATFPGFEFVTSAWVDDATTPGEIIAAFKQNKQAQFGNGATGTGISTSAYNNVVECDVQTGSDAGAKIAAAAALVSSGGVVDCRGLVGAQAIGTTLNLTTSGVTYIFGKATFSIPTGVQINNSGDDVQFYGIGENTVFDYSASTTTSTQLMNFSGNRNHVHDIKLIGNRITACGAGNVCEIGGNSTTGTRRGEGGIKMGTSTVTQGSRIERVGVYNSGFVGIAMDNCKLCSINHNYVEQSYSSAILLNSSQTSFNTVYGWEIAHNRLVDTNVGCGVLSGTDNCGDGQINVISGGGTGVLGPGIVQDNQITNAVKTPWNGIPGDVGAGKSTCGGAVVACSYDGTKFCGGGGANDTGCGQAIQVVYKAQYVSILDNIIIHNSHEGIATAGTSITKGNKVFDASCCSGGAGLISYYVDPGNYLALPTAIPTMSTTAKVVTFTTSAVLGGTCWPTPTCNTAHGSYIRITGATVATYNGIWQLQSENDSTKTYTFILNGAPAADNSGTGTVTIVGVGRGAVIADNIGQDVGLGISLQVGTNGKTDPDNAIFSGISVTGNSVSGILATVQNAYQVVNNCSGCSAHNSTIDHVIFAGNSASGSVTNKFKGPQTTSNVGAFLSGFPQISGMTPATPTFVISELVKGSTALTNKSVFSDSTTTSVTEGAMTYEFCYDMKTVGTQALTLGPVFTWTDENGNAKTHTGLTINMASLTNDASRVTECFTASNGTGDILYTIAATGGAGRYDFKMRGNPIIQ